MNAKPDQNTLMAYLYDELDATQKAEVEAYLTQHPELSEELYQLEETRNILSNLEGLEPEIPTFILPEKPPISLINIPKASKSTFLRNMLASAAMICLLMLLGSLTRLHIALENGNFSLSFGNQNSQNLSEDKKTSRLIPGDYSEDSLQNLIKKEIEKDKSLLITQLEDLNKKINALPKPTISPQKSPQELLNRQDLDKLMLEFQEENLETMLKLLTLAHEDQQKYTNEILGVFAEYLERRREQDLQKIGQNLNNLQINQLKNQQETDRIIVKLIESVNINHHN
ncbi:MAG: hypothetical protein NW226_08705 [Microscillaceae bacterium]|nr:hypothetical protein [Microscillaceae bacterium]